MIDISSPTNFTNSSTVNIMEAGDKAASVLSQIKVRPWNIFYVVKLCKMVIIAVVKLAVGNSEALAQQSKVLQNLTNIIAAQHIRIIELENKMENQ